jgi:hypothetical protein
MSTSHPFGIICCGQGRAQRIIGQKVSADADRNSRPIVGGNVADHRIQLAA